MPTGQQDGFQLYAAAMERSVGRLGMMLNSNEAREAVAGQFATLHSKAKAVHDLESFNQFMLLLKDQRDSLNSNELNDSDRERQQGHAPLVD